MVNTSRHHDGRICHSLLTAIFMHRSSISAKFVRSAGTGVSLAGRRGGVNMRALADQRPVCSFLGHGCCGFRSRSQSIWASGKKTIYLDYAVQYEKIRQVKSLELVSGRRR